MKPKTKSNFQKENVEKKREIKLELNLENKFEIKKK